MDTVNKSFQVIYQILFVLGALGMFLYGMKVMSEALQRFAGARMRKTLGIMTANRFKGLLTGLSTTALIQSSSATTVMVVSFVNAGLLTLSGSIGVIIGANIGTTVTGWLISFIGFKLHIGHLAVSFIGLSLIFLFSRNSKARNWGEFIIGFSLLFIGLEFLKDSTDVSINKDFTSIVTNVFELSEDELTNEVNRLKTNPELIYIELQEIYPDAGQNEIQERYNHVINQLNEPVPEIYRSIKIINRLSALSSDSFLSILLFVFLGALITIIIQSSSATMALTIVMCFHGLISFELGAAMILGENIGTTITANLAAIVANFQAKRVARIHLMYNLFGVIWAVIFFKLLLDGTELIVQTFEHKSAYENPEVIPLALSIFHTAFNIINALIFIWFIGLLEKISIKLLPIKTKKEGKYKLKYIKSGIISTAELSSIQAKKEIIILADKIKGMIELIPVLLMEKKPMKYQNILKKFEKEEKLVDKMEKEITSYLANIASGRISDSSSGTIKAMLKIVDDLESTADVCYQISIRIKNKNEQKIWFTQDIRDYLKKMHEIVITSYDVMLENLNNDFEKVTREHADRIEVDLNALRSEIIKYNVENIAVREYTAEAAQVFTTLASLYERIGDYVNNVTEAIVETKH